MSTVGYPIRSKPGEPPWELATLYPPQGSWTLTEYLNLTTNRLIEFNGGELEFLPMPTEEHQDAVVVLFESLAAFARAHDLGKVYFAPLRVETLADKVREPDVVFMRKENASRRSNRLWHGADLVMEVVSDGPEDRMRDYQAKREEYEEAGIPEYWIVDPRERRITVLTLHDDRYAEHCVANDGDAAESALLLGFRVPVAEVFRRE